MQDKVNTQKPLKIFGLLWLQKCFQIINPLGYRTVGLPDSKNRSFNVNFVVSL